MVPEKPAKRMKFRVEAELIKTLLIRSLAGAGAGGGGGGGGKGFSLRGWNAEETFSVRHEHFTRSISVFDRRV